MYILHLETAISPSSFAICTREQCIFEKILETERSTISQLLPAIDEAFKTLSLTKKDIVAVSLSAGPGSYTGLRIGTSTAKALCYAWEIPLIAISTLALTASAMKQLSKDENDLLIPMIDFKRMEVVYAMYDFNLNIVVPEKNTILESSLFDAFRDKKILFGGNGSFKAKELFRHLSAYFLDENVHLSRFCVPLVWNYFDKKQFADLAYFEPNYGKEYLAKKSQVKGLQPQ